MSLAPRPRCGYDSPGARCPHCGDGASEPSLAREPAGTLAGIVDGVLALPKGIALLASTRGVKRWLLPPLVLTTAVLFACLWWGLGRLNELLEANLPEEFTIEGGWAWIEGLSERWDWLKATWFALVAALEWTVNLGWGLLSSQVARLVAFFLVGSLIAWYCFSIAYEAFAGPFLDEIQARLETKWFGTDPKSRIERPNDLPPERCARLLTQGAVVASALFLGGAWLDAVPLWLALLVAPFGLLAPVLRERRYGPWLAWVARVESRAIVASMQAALFTSILLVLALPLYFVPVVGYLLFATACGFATAVGLLDIPFERRNWPMSLRLRFVGRHLPALIAFGIVSGFLLAVPLIGPVVMVPSASIGGLWLVCRLDKRALRPPAGSPSA